MDEWEEKWLKVKANDQEVNVLAEVNRNAKLTIEWSVEMASLLTMEPDNTENKENLPTLQDPNVRWNNVNHSLQTTYYEASSGKWRLKTMKIDAVANFNELQCRVDAMCPVMQMFREQHHSEPPEDQKAPPIRRKKSLSAASSVKEDQGTD